jgi:hypothetical protein
MNGYVPYNESLYRVGFRPYNTNPRAAASLGGMDGPINHAWGTFGPWVLHGMGDIGQSIPFTARGGQALHGMGDAGIADGSMITYNGTWMSVFNPGTGIQGYAQAIVDAVVAAINQDGALTVLQWPRNLSSSFTGVVKGIIGASEPFNVTLVLQVTNGLGFASVNDVISIIRHYVYQVSGVFPTFDKISSVGAGGGAPNYQGAGPAPDGAAPPPGGAQDWASWFQDNFQWIALGALGLAVLPPLIKRIL